MRFRSHSLHPRVLQFDCLHVVRLDVRLLDLERIGVALAGLVHLRVYGHVAHLMLSGVGWREVVGRGARGTGLVGDVAHFGDGDVGEVGVVGGYELSHPRFFKSAN